jgi:uncharacterized protein YlxW (UPF0749 family)
VTEDHRDTGTGDHRDTGTGWPEPDTLAESTDLQAAVRPDPESGPVQEPEPAARAEPEPGLVDEAERAGPEPGSVDEPEQEPADTGEGAMAGVGLAGGRPGRWSRRRLSSAGAMIVLLVALLGFTLAVQLRSHTTDPTLASARQEDLVRILSDLQARDERLRQEIADLQQSQRQLTSDTQGRQAALAETTKRADELGILAGTLPAQGPGLTVQFRPGRDPIKAESVLDAIEELRGAGAEAMQIGGGNGAEVRVVASTYVVDTDSGIEVDGQKLSPPYVITVIGDAQTMQTALNIAGGVVESVQQAGGTVTVQQPGVVAVKTLHTAASPRFAHPVN